MLNLPPPPRSLYRRRSRPALCHPSSRTLPSLGLADVISLPSALLAPARGSRPLRLPRTRISPRLCSGLLCGVAFACQSGTVTLPVDYAARFLTGGVTTPFAALAEATGFFVTTRSATLFALLCLNLPPFHLSLKNLVSCSLPSPLTLEAPFLAPPPISPRSALPAAAPLTSGSLVVSRASLRPGTLRSPPSSVPPFSPPLSRLWLTFSTKLSPARTPSKTPPPRFPPWVPPSVRSSWRLAAKIGPTPFARSSRGFPPSPAPCAAQPATPPVTSAFELHSASAAPFTGKRACNSQAVTRPGQWLLRNFAPLSLLPSRFSSPSFHLSFAPFLFPSLSCFLSLAFLVLFLWPSRPLAAPFSLLPLLLFLVFPPCCSFGSGFFPFSRSCRLWPLSLFPCSPARPSLPVALRVLFPLFCLFLVCVWFFSGLLGFAGFWGPSLALEVVATLVDALFCMSRATLVGLLVFPFQQENVAFSVNSPSV